MTAPSREALAEELRHDAEHVVAFGAWGEHVAERMLSAAKFIEQSAATSMPAFEAMKGVLQKARRYVQDAEARYAITKGFDTQSVIATSVLAEIDAVLDAIERPTTGGAS